MVCPSRIAAAGYGADHPQSILTNKFSVCSGNSISTVQPCRTRPITTSSASNTAARHMPYKPLFRTTVIVRISLSANCKTRSNANRNGRHAFAHARKLDEFGSECIKLLSNNVCLVNHQNSLMIALKECTLTTE